MKFKRIVLIIVIAMSVQIPVSADSLGDSFQWIFTGKYRITVDTSIQAARLRLKTVRIDDFTSRFPPHLTGFMDDDERKNYGEFFAIGRFIINDDHTGYLIEAMQDANLERAVYCLVLNGKSNLFTQVIKVAFYYCYEGSGGRGECFLSDLNDDSFPDLVMVSYKEAIIAGGRQDFFRHDAENSVLFFKNHEYISYSSSF